MKFNISVLVAAFAARALSAVRLIYIPIAFWNSNS